MSDLRLPRAAWAAEGRVTPNLQLIAEAEDDLLLPIDLSLHQGKGQGEDEGDGEGEEGARVRARRGARVRYLECRRREKGTWVRAAQCPRRGAA